MSVVKKNQEERREKGGAWVFYVKFSNLFIFEYIIHLHCAKFKQHENIK